MGDMPCLRGAYPLLYWWGACGVCFGKHGILLIRGGFTKFEKTVVFPFHRGKGFDVCLVFGGRQDVGTVDGFQKLNGAGTTGQAPRALASAAQRLDPNWVTRAVASAAGAEVG